MCHRHRRSSYGCGYGFGHHRHHRGGPISTLVALAVPLLTQGSSSNRDQLAQEPYQPTTATRDPYLAPQTSGRTLAPPIETTPRPASAPLGPPPAYVDEKRSVPNNAYKDDYGDEEEEDDEEEVNNEKEAMRHSVSNNNDTTPAAIGARDYQPLSYNQQQQPTQVAPANNITAPLAMLDPSSRWAARLQRKEERLHAKLVRKADKYARRERRDIERAACY